MKKWIVRIASAVVVLVILVGVVGYLFLNSAARAAVEQGVGYATQVRTSVGGVRIGLLGGTFNMGKLELGNPTGFEADFFMRLDDTDASLRIGSLTTPTVELPTVTLSGIDLTIERKDGAENYKTILANLQRLAAKDEVDVEKEGGRQLLIRELRLENIQVTLKGYPGMNNRTLKLGDIHLADVGTGDHKVRTSQLMGIVIREIFSQMLQNPDLLPGMLVAGIGEGLQGLGQLGQVGVEVVGQVAEVASQVVGEVVDGVGQAAEGAVDAAGKAAEEAGRAVEGAVEGVGDAARGITEGLGGILGGGRRSQEPQQEPKGED